MPASGAPCSYSTGGWFPPTRTGSAPTGSCTSRATGSSRSTRAGTGTGLRGRRFELTDCAADAAALVRHLGCGPVICVGYSMGGLVAQLMAKRHPEEVAGAVLAATASEQRDSLLLQLVWSGMGVFQWWLKLAPRWAWTVTVNAIIRGDEETTAWVVGELRRGAADDIAEAGRDIGRFDSRPWLEEVRQPIVVLVTTLDLLVPPGRQRELARLLAAPLIELHSDHLASRDHSTPLRSRPVRGARSARADARAGGGRAPKHPRGSGPGEDGLKASIGAGGRGRRGQPLPILDSPCAERALRPSPMA